MADKSPDNPSIGSIPEIYADRVHNLTVRANVTRFALVSERPAGASADTAPVYVGHVAMPVQGFLQLYAQMRSIVEQMQARGLITSAPKQPEAAAAPAKKARKTAANGASGGEKKRPSRSKKT